MIPGHAELPVLVDAPMSNYTTWRIGGFADFLVRTPTPDSISIALQWALEKGMPVTAIGGGSNLLVGDQGVRGLVVVIKTPGERAENLVDAVDEGDSVRLRVAAQAPLSWTGRYACERGWSGMSWGVGLPGQIGGAAVNNAGAHGVEMKDHLVGVTLLNADGTVAERDSVWLDSSYRRTAIKDLKQPRNTIVLAVTLLLPKADREVLLAEADAHAAYRKASQPTGRCAGSTFTNPPEDFAGRLLEAAGLKGYAIGGVSYSAKHSNFIVNNGSGTAAQVRELIEYGKQQVLEQCGIELHAEIEEIGEFTHGT